MGSKWESTNGREESNGGIESIEPKNLQHGRIHYFIRIFSHEETIHKQ